MRVPPEDLLWRVTNFMSYETLDVAFEDLGNFLDIIDAQRSPLHTIVCKASIYDI